MSADLAGLQAGLDMWGTQSKEVEFRIGRSVMSVVDVAAHQMTVTIDGTSARSIPVTTDKDGFLTRGGTRVISEKEAKTRMDAASTGIVPGDPEYYNLDVRYAMRMTNSGGFIHAAPWAVESRQGQRQPRLGGHEPRGRHVFERSRVGDVVVGRAVPDTMCAMSTNLDTADQNPCVAGAQPPPEPASLRRQSTHRICDRSTM